LKKVARVSSRTRITAALIGLIALVVIGWFARDFLGHPQTQHRGSAMQAAVLGHPGGFAFLREGADAFLPFGTGEMPR
jgi:hypothetical protein